MCVHKGHHKPPKITADLQCMLPCPACLAASHAFCTVESKVKPRVCGAAACTSGSTHRGISQYPFIGGLCLIAQHGTPFEVPHISPEVLLRPVHFLPLIKLLLSDVKAPIRQIVAILPDRGARPIALPTLGTWHRIDNSANELQSELRSFHPLPRRTRGPGRIR